MHLKDLFSGKASLYRKAPGKQIDGFVFHYAHVILSRRSPACLAVEAGASPALSLDVDDWFDVRYRIHEARLQAHHLENVLVGKR